MYLKRLELCGFKSFADRTRLDFEPGITAIIGPNGCGKSNTADAIRWCLGEQSARSLRSHQMMDVVFGGSQSRATTGMAEVALTFDNSRNMLPIDYSEVTVTRRLFRSGESEYFINKVQCRLKDIRDLFLDTGIGTEGYAIIEQGKVEFLLTAKPEERREMFEEAAGVSKYKVRREETLRKLEKVDVDMNRINDMLALLKEQINALDLAARKARQYQKHKDDLRRLEITSLVHGVQKSIGETQRIAAVLEPRSQEFERLNAAIVQIEADLAQIRVDQIEKDELYVKLQDEYSHIKAEINLSDERIRQAVQREQELNERRATVQGDRETDTAKTAQSRQEISLLSAAIQELRTRVAALEQEYQSKERQLQELRNRLFEHQNENAQLRTRLLNAAGEKVSLRNEQNRLTSQLAHCQARALSLQKELSRLNEQHGPLTGEIASREAEHAALTQRIGEAGIRRDALVQRLDEMARQKTAIEQHLAALKENIVSSESKRRTLKEWEEKDPLRVTMREILSLGIPGIRGPLSSLIHTEPAHESIVAEALGEKLNYMVCDTVGAARAAIHHLQENNRGRMAFAVLEKVPERGPSPSDPVSAASLLSLLQPEAGTEKLLSLLCADTYIEGTAVSSGVVLRGGGTITFDKPVLIEEQIRRIDESVAAGEREIAGITEEMSRCTAQLAAVQEERTANDLEQQKLSIDREWVIKHIASLREELAYLDKEVAVILADLQNNDTEEKNIKGLLERIEEQLVALDGIENAAKERQEQLDTEIHRLREEETALALQLTEAKVSWAGQASELAGREREEEKLKETIASLTARSEQFRMELESLENKLRELKHLQETESARLSSLMQEQSQKEGQVQASLSERQKLGQQLEERNNELHEQRQQIETLKQEIHDLQLEQRSYELQKQGMEQRLNADFSVSFTESRDEYLPLAWSDEDIQRLKRRLESMGAVNLAAPEEYANLEERYNFLLTQQQDLVKAKEDLHQVIAKINHNTRENFKKTFELVRENFRSIYHQLFEGGEADLILTDESNLLECGVDIFAQPPGKKLQNIALLSGGEKALTAIALLFAFFMVKPSPFCILDEVDAPLDDANIGRYIGMIKTFAQKSQFLVITHNKRTMEMADVLYGVTMEELGVSKIISVRLNRENMAATA